MLVSMRARMVRSLRARVTRALVCVRASPTTVHPQRVETLEAGTSATLDPCHAAERANGTLARSHVPRGSAR